jgi:hypothetical protein
MKTSLPLPTILRSEKGIRGAQLFAAAVVVGLVFWRLQFSSDAICCGDFDGYYHIRWSRMLWEGLRHRSFPPIFSWLPLTTLNPRDYVDHHLLFHVFQIPFTFGDLRLGAKIASLIFASLAVLSCYWLLLRFHIRYSPGLAAGVACVFCAVSFPAQHGEGSAVRDYLSRNRHYPIVQEEVLAPRAARVCLLADLRHGCVADPGSLFLGDCYRVD